MKRTVLSTLLSTGSKGGNFMFLILLLCLSLSITGLFGIQQTTIKKIPAKFYTPPQSQSGRQAIKIFDSQDIKKREGVAYNNAGKAYRRVFNSASHSLQLKSNQRLYIAGGSSGKEYWGVDDELVINGNPFTGIKGAYDKRFGPLPTSVLKAPLEITNLLQKNQQYLQIQLVDYGVVYANTPIYIIIEEPSSPPQRIFAAQNITERTGKARYTAGKDYRFVYKNIDISIIRGKTQKVFIAGNEAGNAFWGVDDAIEINDKSFSGIKAAYTETSVPLPPKVLMAPKDISDLIPPDQNFTLHIKLVDYGVTYGCTDIYFVVK